MSYFSNESDNIVEKFFKDWEAKFSDKFKVPITITFHYPSEQHNLPSSKSLSWFKYSGGYITFDHYLKVYINVKKNDNEAILYYFKLTSLTGLCGTAVLTKLTSTGTRSTIEKGLLKDSCLLILDFVKELAYKCKYASILCSNIVPPVDKPLQQAESEYRRTLAKFKENLLKSGFTVINDYVNRRSDNRINIFQINL